MILLTGELSSTATYAARTWAWVSLGAGFVTIDRVLPSGEIVQQSIPALGKLSIRQQFRQRRYGAATVAMGDDGNKVKVGRDDIAPLYAHKPTTWEADTYAVQEFDSEYPGSRHFVLENLTDPNQNEPYSVHVGGIQKCRCMAGDCKVVTGCKHVHACEALLSLGVFDDLETPADSNERSGQWCEPDLPEAEPEAKPEAKKSPEWWLEPCSF